MLSQSSTGEQRDMLLLNGHKARRILRGFLRTQETAHPVLPVVAKLVRLQDGTSTPPITNALTLAQMYQLLCSTQTSIAFRENFPSDTQTDSLYSSRRSRRTCSSLSFHSNKYSNKTNRCGLQLLSTLAKQPTSSYPSFLISSLLFCKNNASSLRLSSSSFREQNTEQVFNLSTCSSSLPTRISGNPERMSALALFFVSIWKWA